MTTDHDVPTIGLLEQETTDRAPATLGELRSDLGGLPLTAVDVDADVVGLFATVRLVQTFHNPHAQPIEAVYVFPLPDRAAVHSCVAVLGGRRIEAQLKERQEARDEYFAALDAGKRAALAEEDRPDVFTISVGNLAAGEDATITLELSMALAVDGDEVTFRFPLVVAPRYVPGDAIDGGRAGDGVADDTDAVPDASRVTPPRLLDPARGPDARVTVRIGDAGLGVHDISSSLHAARVGHERGLTTLALQPDADARGGLRLDRDVIVRYRFDADLKVCATAAGDDRDGVVLVNAVAPRASTARPRDVAILLDRSGSMAGWKMVTARRAAQRIVESLTATDRVWAAGFDTVVEHSPATLELTQANDRVRARTGQFLADLDARGGTELGHALLEAAKSLVPGEETRDRFLVLVTDGQVADEDRLLGILRDALQGVRVVAVGVDRAVNAGLLRRLAADGGTWELVESHERLDGVLTRVVRRVAAPAVTGLRVELDGDTRTALVDGTLTPAGAVDVAPGACSTLALRYSGARPARVTVVGTNADGSEYRHEVATTHTDNPAPRRAWARLRVRDLEDDLARGRGTEDAVVAHSLAERVLCRYTAFVAVDDDGTEVNGPASTVVQPVALPSGWAGVAAGLRSEPRGLALEAPTTTEVAGFVTSTTRTSRFQVRGGFGSSSFDPAVTEFLERVNAWHTGTNAEALADLLTALDELIAAQIDAHGEDAPVVLALQELRAVLDPSSPTPRTGKRRGFWRERR